MVRIRGLVLALLLLPAVAGQSAAQLNIDGLENAVGRNALAQLKKSAAECHSNFLSTLNTTLFSALRSRGLISTAPEVFVFNMRQLNAFAIPSGKIIVTPPLLATMQSSDEYTGVLFHELGHVVLGHIQKKIMFEAVRSMMFSGDFARASSVLLTLSYSRGQEAEADEFAAKAMAAIGHSPINVGAALLRISNDASLKAKSDILSTHPLTIERVKMLKEYGRTLKLAEPAVALPQWRSIDLTCR
jgi:predicted Zn-dependent protease